MGDRCYVYLTIQESDKAAVKKFLGDSMAAPFQEEAGARTYTYEFEEVNYGNLGCEQQLQLAGIPYTKYWDGGDEYGPGEEFCRYTDKGELEVKTCYESEDNLSLSRLEELIKQFEPNPTMGFEMIEHAVMEKRESITPLPWDDQEVNRKTFRTLLLIKQPA